MTREAVSKARWLARESRHVATWICPVEAFETTLAEPRARGVSRSETRIFAGTRTPRNDASGQVWPRRHNRCTGSLSDPLHCVFPRDPMSGSPLTAAPSRFVSPVACRIVPVTYRIVMVLCAGLWVIAGGPSGPDAAQASCGDYLVPMPGAFGHAVDNHTPPGFAPSSRRIAMPEWPAGDHLPPCSGPMCGEGRERAPSPYVPVVTRFVTSRDGQLLVAVVPDAIVPEGLSPLAISTVATGADRPGPAVPPPVAAR